MTEKINAIDISEIDLNKAFFHYTNVDNLDSITINGLEPKIGKNSRGIEKSEKIFFSIGDKGVLVLMDAWLKWLILRPSNDIIYRLGAFFMTQPYFPKIIVDVIFNNWIKNKNRADRACKKLKHILDNSIFLILNLEEKNDFDYDDIDEIKDQKFSRKQIKYIYSYDFDIENTKMEYWNMHTYTGRTINKDKISLLKVNNRFSANNILQYIASSNKTYIDENCKFLQKYLELLNIK